MSQAALSTAELAILQLEAANAESQIDYETAQIVGTLAHRLLCICEPAIVRASEDAIKSVERSRVWEQKTASLLKAAEDERRGLLEQVRMLGDAATGDGHDGGDPFSCYHAWNGG